MRNVRKSINNIQRVNLGLFDNILGNNIA